MKKPRLVRGCALAAIVELLLFCCTVSAQRPAQNAPSPTLDDIRAMREQQVLSGSAQAAPAIKLNLRPNNQNNAIIVVLKQQALSAQARAIPTVQPEKTMGVSGSETSRTVVRGNVVQMACTGTKITGVNGKPAGIYFTPTEPYNSYVIQGCFPGDVPKSVYLRAATSFRPQMVLESPTPQRGLSQHCAAGVNIDLAVDFPSSSQTGPRRPTPADPHREIDVHVPPCITGALDQNGNSVTVVAEFSNGDKAELGGFNFFAARETVLLKNIPKSAVNTLQSQILRPGTTYKYVSPFGNESAGVLRYSQGAPFSPGADKFNLNELQLGFAVLAPELKPFPMTSQTCQKVLNSPLMQAQQQGLWSIQWGDDPLTFFVHYQVGLCQRVNAPLMPASQPLLMDSVYAINVPVEGPRGVDPWRGR